MCISLYTDESQHLFRHSLHSFPLYIWLWFCAFLWMHLFPSYSIPHASHMLVCMELGGCLFLGSYHFSSSSEFIELKCLNSNVISLRFFPHLLFVINSSRAEVSKNLFKGTNCKCSKENCSQKQVSGSGTVTHSWPKYLFVFSVRWDPLLHGKSLFTPAPTEVLSSCWSVCGCCLLFAVFSRFRNPSLSSCDLFIFFFYCLSKATFSRPLFCSVLWRCTYLFICLFIVFCVPLVCLVPMEVMGVGSLGVT